MLDIDLMEFAEHLEGSGLTDEEMREYLTIFWEIVIAFVDLGFGLNPAQIACEKLLKNTEKTSFLSADSLDLQEFTDTIEEGVQT